MQNSIPNSLNKILAEIYALYLKTQNYHWNITGPNFYGLHKMLEEQYQDHAAAIDVMAERIRALGSKVKADFSYFDEYKVISSPDHNYSATQMLEDLVASQDKVIKSYQQLADLAAEQNDKSTEDMVISRIEAHQMQRWMLHSSVK